MRPVWLAITLCGCNQIYGLEPTRARDAGEPPSDRAMRLALLVGGMADGKETPATLEALPDPRVRIGLVGADLRDASYVVEAGMGGLVDYPFELVDKRWRVEFSPPHGPPHELQWNPPPGAGFVVVPMTGRIERPAPPVAGGYQVTMALGSDPDMLHDFAPNTVIYTAGYWSATPAPFGINNPTVRFDEPATVPLDGSRSVPRAGDSVVAVEYGVEAGTQCRLATLSGGAPAAEVAASTLQPIKLTPHLMKITPADVTLAFNGELIGQASSRLTGALGPLAAAATDGRLRFGRIAHAAIPPFTAELESVPSPPMIPIFECAITKTPADNSNNVGSLALATAYHGSITSDRTASGALLRSSIAFVAYRANGAYQASTEIPLATGVKLGATPLASDGATLQPTDQDLTFTFDRGLPHIVDYVEATLYRIQNATLVPVRVYITADNLAAPTLRIDASLVTPGVPHVFAIRTYRGRPGAPNGDFRAVEGFQTVGTIFTATFTR